jgi:hypothetical protein
LPICSGSARAYDPRIRTIALVDHTKQHRPPPGALEAIAEALTVQVRRDLAPAWGVTDARFTVGGRGEKIHFFDSADEATDYGWHIVDDEGDPYAHVFAAPSIDNGSDWVRGPDPISVSASHEALEMFTDPRANEYCFDWDRYLWAREVCDPVQERSYKIVAGGIRVPVSDFVLPAYFNADASGPYDHLGVLKQPFSLDKGGYAVRERFSRDEEVLGRRFGVDFEDAMPDWQRTEKLEGWGRTFWRLALTAPRPR